LHGAKLLKKPHQATAVQFASHMWWQSDFPVVEGADESATKKPLRDGKRILECLQMALRIASTSIQEIVTVQLYCDALDRYIYYFERQVAEVMPKYINSLVELITSNIDSISSGDLHPSARAPPGLVEGVHTPDMIIRHFKNTLLYIQAKKENQEESPVDWDAIDIVGASLKMGIARS
jgi:vacuolar protein sorting-associated protein 35